MGSRRRPRPRRRPRADRSSGRPGLAAARRRARSVIPAARGRGDPLHRPSARPAPQGSGRAPTGTQPAVTTARPPSRVSRRRGRRRAAPITGEETDADEEGRGQRPLGGAEARRRVVADARDQGAPSEEDDPGGPHHEERGPTAISRILWRPGHASRGGCSFSIRPARVVAAVDQLCQLGVGKICERLAHIRAISTRSSSRCSRPSGLISTRTTRPVVAGAAAGGDEASAFGVCRTRLGDGAAERLGAARAR